MSPPDRDRLEGRARRILSNGAALLGAYVLPRFFTVASVVVAARWLGAEQFGAYGTAAAYAVIASAVATLGMLPLLVREIAREPARAPAILAAAHTVKAVASILMVAGAAWAASRFFSDPDVRAAALVLSLGWVMNAFAENLAAYYQAVERMGRWTQASALFGVISASVGVPLLILTDSLVAYCWGFVAGWSVALTWLQAGLPPAARGGGLGGRSEVVLLLRGLAPFAAAFVGVAVYSKVDVLLLERWRGAGEAGLYAAAYKFIDVFQALLVVAAGAVYPHLSRQAGRGAAGTRSLEIILLIAVPVGLALHLASRPLVATLYGSGYAGAEVALSRLALLMPLLSLTILGSYVLGAAGRMLPVAGVYAAGITANVALNAVLIPSSGAGGAALARLGSEVLMVGGFLITLSAAAPRPRALVSAAASAALSAGCLLLPDPTGGWLRAALFLSATAGVYRIARPLTPVELSALRRAAFGRPQPEVTP